MSSSTIRQRRNLFRTFFRGIAASCSEGTSAWHIQWTGYISFENDSLLLSADFRIRYRYRRKQGEGVGMNGMIVQLIRIGDFHDLSKIHHRNSVRQVMHNQEIMGNEEIGYPQFLLKVFKHIKHLCLNGNIQG